MDNVHLMLDLDHAPIERGFKFNCYVTARTWPEQIRWLLEILGPIGDKWEYHRSEVWFKTEEDRIMFLLRWTGDTK